MLKQKLLTLAILATLLPTPAYAATTGVKQVSASDTHTAILKTDGSLWMVGLNTFGQLGIDTANMLAEPEQVMTGVKDIAVGKHFTAILKTDGSLWTCGSNIYGQLGTTLAKNVFCTNTPVQILTGVKDLSAGEDFVMAIKTDNTLWGWGCNSGGVLATNKLRISAKPVKIMDSVWQVAAGADHVAVIKTNGSLWTWGDSTVYKLGYASTGGIIYEPKQILAYGAQSVAVGPLTTAFIKTDGTLWMCGNNELGRLGIGKKYQGEGSYSTGAPTDLLPPIPVKVLSDVKVASLSTNSSFALKTDGTLWAWGDNSFGQFGNGTKAEALSPVKVSSGVSSVATSSTYTIITKTDGSLWASGSGILNVATDSKGTPRYSTTLLGGLNSTSFKQY